MESTPVYSSIKVLFVNKTMFCERQLRRACDQYYIEKTNEFAERRNYILFLHVCQFSIESVHCRWRTDS